MDALELIKQNLTDEVATDVLSSYGFLTRISGRQIRSHCELHGGDNASSFSYSLNNHMYYCHRCHAGGDLIQLIETMESITFVEACNKVLGLLGMSIEGLEYKKRNDQYEKELKAFIQHATKKKTILPAYELPVTPRMVKKYRQFSEETLTHFELGFIDEMMMDGSNGQFKATNRLSMPIVFNKEVVGYAFRRQKNTDNPKWLFQPYALNKREILYHLDRHWYEEIIICEGIYDVWAWWQSGYKSVTCVLGSSLSDEQIAILQRITTRLVLSYDNDNAGREATLKTIAKTKSKFDVLVVTFPEGTDPVDNIDTLDKIYNNKVHWRDYK